MSSGDAPVVSLHAVTVEAGSTRALDGVSLDVWPGERVALVGPSGAGKTTLLMVINGTVVPGSGDVTVLGHTPGAPGRGRAVRSRVGTIYQQLHLAGPLQVVHNVNAGRLARWPLARALWSLIRPQQLDEALAILDRVGIAHKIRQRTERLSGGEQQRVAIARVLAQQPELLLADEPVSSLDPGRAREVMDLLRGLVVESGRTLVVSLHAFDLARSHCDRIVGLRGGRTVFDAPADTVTDKMAATLYGLGAAGP
jgi:phosphonate transport system ATP-binding protein